MTRQRLRTIGCLFVVLAMARPVAASAAAAEASKSSAVAVSKKFGLGGMAGDPTGFTIKFFILPRHAIDVTVGLGWFAGPGLAINVDYLFHLMAARTLDFDLPFYFGGGVKFIVWFLEDCHYYWGNADPVCRRNDERRFGFALRAPVGVAFHLTKIPLEIFGEVGVALGLYPGIGAMVDGGAGVRYYF